MDEREEVSAGTIECSKGKVAENRKIDFFWRNFIPAFVFMRLTTATEVEIGENALF